jgi:hypothetical protein
MVTRMMELKKQQARAPKKQSPGARQLLDQKLAITENQGQSPDSARPIREATNPPIPR